MTVFAFNPLISMPGKTIFYTIYTVTFRAFSYFCPSKQQRGVKVVAWSLQN